MPEFTDRLQSALGNDYIIERELGGGGMSRVFVATERLLQRKVVIKVLPPELSGGVNIDRFRREIQLAAQLQHPHIVPLLTASSDHEILWFAMPFIEGSSLRSTLEKSHRLPPRDVVRILHDVVDALAYAHARGVVHRDIKPDNILTSGMHALVTDFGVAKALSAAIPTVVGTTTGMAIGTPAYMAPEQLAADPAADHRVDIYAVGLLAYELLTGKSPFSGASPQATLAAQLTLVPDAPHRTLPDIPLALSNVVMRCLEKDSAKRFQSAGEMLLALDELPPMAGSGSVIAPAPPRRRWVFPAAAALMLIAAIALANSLIGDRTGGDRLARIDDSSGTAANVNADVARRDTTSLANIDNDNSRGTSLPLVITRAESLAIAAAIQQRAQPSSAAAPRAPAAPTTPDLGQGNAALGSGTQAAGSAQALEQSHVFIASPGTQFTVDREMLRKEVQRVFADSFAMAFARVDSTLANLPRIVRMDGAVPRVATSAITPLIGPPDEGTFRVVVTPFTPRSGVSSELARYGVDVADALRGALSRVDKIDVTSPELTERASRGSGDRMVAGWRLRADYLVTGAYSVHGDSIRIIMQLTDVRTGRFTRADHAVIPVADARRGLETTSTRILAWLDTARTMPGRHGPPRGAFAQPGQGVTRPPDDGRSSNPRPPEVRPPQDAATRRE